jgi:hypothetical protein
VIKKTSINNNAQQKQHKVMRKDNIKMNINGVVLSEELIFCST